MALTLVGGGPAGAANAVQGGDAPPDPGAEEARLGRLELLGVSLGKRRDEWVRARRASGVEKRWLDDLDQYLGRDPNAERVATMMDSVQAGFPVVSKGDTKPQRSTVFVNITRPKTNAAEARVADMVFPSDDRNFGIKQTPVPELAAHRVSDKPIPPMIGQPQAMVAQTGVNGQPVVDAQGQPQQRVKTEADVAEETLKAAALSAKAMQDEIDDAFTECEYNTQGRMMLHDASVLGTGIFKGPIVKNRVRRAWTQVEGGTYQMVFAEAMTPATEQIPPWMVYPDPACGQNIHDGNGIFEKRLLPARKLRALAKQKGYIKAAIQSVLQQGPTRTVAEDEHEVQLKKEAGYPVGDADLFEVWEYWGTFDVQDLIAAGVDIKADTLDTKSGVVIMVNNIVIKAFENPLEDGDLPYDFFVWEKADRSPWGYGVPHLMRTPQRVLNAAWRQTMDNAGLSVGPQIVVKPGIITPADKQWALTGRKIWFCTDDSANVKDAFTTFDFPSHLDDLTKIIELAMKFADEETSVPKLAQGERGEAPDTVGGMTILMNSANVVLRRLVKQFDDMITRPHVQRYYDWFMAYSDKEAIKGDFTVDARGSSALLVKDMQQQALVQMGSYMASPVVGPMVNWDAWFKEVLKSQHVDSSNILKTDEEIRRAQAQPPQPDPRIQATTIQVQGRLKEAQIKQDTAMHTAQARQEGEIVYVETERAMAHDNALARLEEMRLKREILLLEYAQKMQLTLEEVKGQLANTAIKERNKRDLAVAEHEMQSSERGLDRQHEAAQNINAAADKAAEPKPAKGA